MATSRVDFDIQVAGLKELHEGLRAIADRSKQRSIIGDSLSRSGKAIVIPEMRRQMAADFKHKRSHKNRKGVQDGRGAGGPAERNVTARRARLRYGELVAVNFGPRAWWSHLPIAGTRPHSLAANRGERGRWSVLPFRPDARAARRARRELGTRAISFVGSTGPSMTRGSVRANAGLRHPGTRGTDSIRKAVAGVVPRLNERYVADLSTAYERYISRPTRQAKPRTPGT